MTTRQTRRSVPELLTMDEAAEQLNTSVRFVRRLVSERRIPFIHLGRHVRITAEDLQTYVESGRVQTPAPVVRPRGGGSRR